MSFLWIMYCVFFGSLLSLIAIILLIEREEREIEMSGKKMLLGLGICSVVFLLLPSLWFFSYQRIWQLIFAIMIVVVWFVIFLVKILKKG